MKLGCCKQLPALILWGEWQVLSVKWCSCITFFVISHLNIHPYHIYNIIKSNRSESGSSVFEAIKKPRCALFDSIWIKRYQTTPKFELSFECVCALNVGMEPFGVDERRHHLRLRLVGLSSAGYSVADTCTSHRVDRLHNDKGPLLQRGHRQMPVIRHRLQVGAVSWPHRVPHLQDPHLVGPRLKESRGWGE